MLRKILAASLTGLALARDLPLPDKANTASLLAPTRHIVEFSGAGSSKFRKRDGFRDTDGFYDAVKEVVVDVKPSLNFTSDIFHGASFDLANTTAESIINIQALGEIARVWPIEIYRLPTPTGNSSLRTDDDDPPVMTSPKFKRYHRHLLTNILEVHQRGFNGSGVVVAVVDSGLDYTHPSLGGGFGLGFRVEAGYSVTIPAKSSSTVQLDFTEPTDLEERFLAQYGGNVHVIGDNGESVKVTYTGIRGSFKDAQSWETQFGVPPFYNANDQTFRDGAVFPFLNLPKIHFNILCSTREVSFDVVRANWTRADWKYPPTRDENNWLQPRSGEFFLFTLGDTYASGESVEPGEYRILARALRNYGDYDNIEDWQIRVSNVFVVARGQHGGCFFGCPYDVQCGA